MLQQSFELLSLSLIPGLGNARIWKILRRLDSPSEIFRIPRAGLRALGLSTEIQYYILGGWARKDAEEAVSRARKKGIGIISLYEQEYPSLLREIADPPLVLYVTGESACLSRPMIAVVGSRRCSVYGSEVAFTLARDLVRHGLTVTSGMALGIDTKAHEGALRAGGPTIAVLGTGADFVYPRSSRKLYDRIRERGCVVSEFPLGTLPVPQNFPIRNRIISGLSLGTVIPEASEFSGSLITARLTLEQNRELWAVPGNITNAGSYGPNHLIKQGAKPVLSFQDVLEELPIQVLNCLEKELEEANESMGEELTEDESAVLQLLTPDASRHFDQLLEETGRSVTDLSGVLVGLESKGRIRVHPGRCYSRRLDRMDGSR